MKMSISIPDEIAAILAKQPNASAYIAEAVRMRQTNETLREMLARHGYEVSDEGTQRMRQALAERRQRLAAKRAAA